MQVRQQRDIWWIQGSTKTKLQLNNYWIFQIVSKPILTQRSIQILVVQNKWQNFVWLLTLFTPAYFGISGTRGGHIVPPLSILGLGGVRVPILFGNDLPMNDWPYSKGFMKFGCLEPSKSMFDFWIFLLIERRLSKFVRAPLMKFQYFWQTIFFRRNEKISWGKKHTALLKYHNWEKSSFFSTLLRVFVWLHANAWQGGEGRAQCAPRS